MNNALRKFEETVRRIDREKFLIVGSLLKDTNKSKHVSCSSHDFLIHTGFAQVPNMLENFMKEDVNKIKKISQKYEGIKR